MFTKIGTAVCDIRNFGYYACMLGTSSASSMHASASEVFWFGIIISYTLLLCSREHTWPMLESSAALALVARRAFSLLGGVRVHSCATLPHFIYVRCCDRPPTDGKLETIRQSDLTFSLFYFNKK